MFGLGKRKQQQTHLGSAYERLVTLPEMRLEDLADRYVKAMETEEGDEWCRCVWAVHPDDAKIKRGHCRICNGANKDRVHYGLPEDFEMGDSHQFRGRRQHRGDEHPTCPRHTRAGFLLYFFEWAEKQGVK